MISTVKREIAIEKELRSKIEWACTFSNCEPKIKNGNLRMVKKTNIAYVEPHRVFIKDKLYLFFNEHEYFYIGNLACIFRMKNGPKWSIIIIEFWTTKLHNLTINYIKIS